ncbi:hypothetical protein PAXRUDRAFT_823543 [Paxillus rubicundulus Ve08.2h10]|uniref:Uncharacterized protein n=1 Tax=Paxillus rubicundulus Ve08.2h10 TaxID=930991 RepID=A0A0D0EC51_9AGAM|nr:hypothetical protein PAXRUDRAFT_823543 [Paxillus rubicundulus Ve08.2h10]
MEDHQERLLGILQAHGQQFLSSFDIPTITSKRLGQGNVSLSRHLATEEFESDEEWEGFKASGNTESSSSEIGSTEESDDGFEQEDDGFTASSSRTPDVIVFSDLRPKSPEANLSSKELRKSFMSSKVIKVTSSSTTASSTNKMSNEGLENESTNAQNDALLHRLVHTKLLSGSLNPELDLNHAKREKAFSGRVLELAGGAKLGKGESSVRKEESNKAAKRVREGLLRRKREREQTALEVAKNLGNYHPTLKRLYDSSLSSVPRKKRDRGLKMGVGKFVGGTLKLSREEIATVAGPSRKLGEKGSGRGRGRGRGR